MNIFDLSNDDFEKYLHKHIDKRDKRRLLKELIDNGLKISSENKGNEESDWL